MPISKRVLGDYIHLMQLHKELKEDEPKDIELKWIEPAKEDPGGAK